jgi:hypothetical protein
MSTFRGCEAQRFVISNKLKMVVIFFIGIDLI